MKTLLGTTALLLAITGLAIADDDPTDAPAEEKAACSKIEDAAEKATCEEAQEAAEAPAEEAGKGKGKGLNKSENNKMEKFDEEE
jgi:hypothetical protein